MSKTALWSTSKLCVMALDGVLPHFYPVSKLRVTGAQGKVKRALTRVAKLREVTKGEESAADDWKKAGKGMESDMDDMDNVKRGLKSMANLREATKGWADVRKV